MLAKVMPQTRFVQHHTYIQTYTPPPDATANHTRSTLHTSAAVYRSTITHQKRGTAVTTHHTRAGQRLTRNPFALLFLELLARSCKQRPTSHRIPHQLGRFRGNRRRPLTAHHSSTHHRIPVATHAPDPYNTTRSGTAEAAQLWQRERSSSKTGDLERQTLRACFYRRCTLVHPQVAGPDPGEGGAFDGIEVRVVNLSVVSVDG